MSFVIALSSLHIALFNHNLHNGDLSPGKGKKKVMLCTRR